MKLWIFINKSDDLTSINPSRVGIFDMIFPKPGRVGTSTKFINLIEFLLDD